MSNYQPAVWEGSNAPNSSFTSQNFNQNQDFNNQDFNNQGFIHDDRLDDNTSPANRRWIDHDGRQCQIVCRPAPRPQNPRFIANQIIGLPIDVARRRFHGTIIRVVIRNGQQLPTTMDFNANRINVETRNLNDREIIIKVVGFY